MGEGTFVYLETIILLFVTVKTGNFYKEQIIGESLHVQVVCNLCYICLGVELLLIMFFSGVPVPYSGVVMSIVSAPFLLMVRGSTVLIN